MSNSADARVTDNFTAFVFSFRAFTYAHTEKGVVILSLDDSIGGATTSSRTGMRYGRSIARAYTPLYDITDCLAKRHQKSLLIETVHLNLAIVLYQYVHILSVLFIVLDIRIVRSTDGISGRKKKETKKSKTVR